MGCLLLQEMLNSNKTVAVKILNKAGCLGRPCGLGPSDRELLCQRGRLCSPEKRRDPPGRHFGKDGITLQSLSVLILSMQYHEKLSLRSLIRVIGFALGPQCDGKGDVRSGKGGIYAQGLSKVANRFTGPIQTDQSRPQIIVDFRTVRV
jgi:hypothetical protein